MVCGDQQTYSIIVNLKASRFWAIVLEYMNAYTGYYFSIRSGNWNLRNACMPKLAELCFAYAHNKYEELVCKSIRDAKKLPTEVLAAFARGEWVVSVTGNPYHSQAMDEAHESCINKSTKYLTTQPTLYRIVKLANFMAILSKMWKALKQLAFKYSKKKKKYEKNTTTEYMLAIKEKITEANLLLNDRNRNLCNIFSSKVID